MATAGCLVVAALTVDECSGESSLCGRRAAYLGQLRLAIVGRWSAMVGDHAATTWQMVTDLPAGCLVVAARLTTVSPRLGYGYG